MPLFGSPNVEKLKAQRDIQGLRKALHHRNSMVRRDAARALGVLGDSGSVDLLTTATRDTDAQVRAAAQEALRQLTISPPAPTPPVAREADKVDTAAPGQMEPVAQQPGSLEALVATLRSQKSASEREQAAKKLGVMRDPRAIAPLTAALRDSERDVRAMAAKALERFNDPQVIESVAAVLRDGDANVRKTAVKVLGHIKDVRVIEPLVAALGDADRDVRMQAAIALKLLASIDHISDPSAGAPLIAVLQNTREDKSVRKLAAEALGDMGDAQALDPLLKVLHAGTGSLEDWDLQRSVIRALGELG